MGYMLMKHDFPRKLHTHWSLHDYLPGPYLDITCRWIHANSSLLSLISKYLFIYYVCAGMYAPLHMCGEQRKLLEVCSLLALRPGRVSPTALLLLRGAGLNASTSHLL